VALAAWGGKLMVAAAKGLSHFNLRDFRQQAASHLRFH
jgi:hypothetical protein